MIPTQDEMNDLSEEVALRRQLVDDVKFIIEKKKETEFGTIPQTMNNTVYRPVSSWCRLLLKRKYEMIKEETLDEVGLKKNKSLRDYVSSFCQFDG